MQTQAGARRRAPPLSATSGVDPAEGEGPEGPHALVSEGGESTMWIHRNDPRLADASGEVDLQAKASLVDEDPNCGSPQWNAHDHKLSKGQDDQDGGQE